MWGLDVNEQGKQWLSKAKYIETRKGNLVSLSPLAGLSGMAGIGIEWHVKFEVVKTPAEGEKDLPATKGRQKAE